jgi:hypothetical protein
MVELESSAEALPTSDSAISDDGLRAATEQSVRQTLMVPFKTA